MQNPYLTESNPYMEIKNPYMDNTAKDEPSALRRAGRVILQTPRGIAEAGASLVTGMYDYPAAAVGRIAGRTVGMSEDEAQELGTSLTSKFQPETPLGKRAASAFGRVMEPIVGVTVEEPSRIVGQRFNSKQAEDIAKLGAMIIAPKVIGKATGYTKSQARIAADTIRERTDLSSLTDVVKERGKGESVSQAVENPYLVEVKAEANPYMETPKSEIVEPVSTPQGVASLNVEKSSYNGKTQLIAKAGNKEIGEIALIERPDGNLEVSNVLVWPEFQKQGMGTELYRQAFNETQVQGKKLYISQDRTADAIALHKRFKENGILRNDGEINFKADRPSGETKIYRQGNVNGNWWSFDEDYAYSFGKTGKTVNTKTLPKDIKLIDEIDLNKQKLSTETIDQTLERLGYDGMTRLEEQMTGPSTTSVYLKSPKPQTVAKPSDAVSATPETIGTGVKYGDGFYDAKFTDMRIGKPIKEKNVVSRTDNEYGLTEVVSREKGLDIINLLDKEGTNIGGISQRTYPNGEIKIGEIYLEPEYRGTGIAQYLYSKFPEAKPGEARTIAAIKARRKYDDKKATPITETPAIDAEMKPHRTAQRVEVEAISRELLDREGLGENIAKYEVEKGMMEAQARMGVEIMDRDYNAAVKMAMGEIPAPEGVRPGTMVTAVAKRAFEKGDFETAYKLGTTSEAFTVAKEIAKDLKSFDQGLNNNPVTAMQAVIKARKEELARTGEKVDPIKQNAEIERLKTLLDDANKRLEEQTVKGKPKQRYGSQNKIVTQSEYLRVKEELRAQLGSQFNAVIDPTIAAKMVKIGTYHLEAGARSFASWSKVVLEDVGEWAKPHLEDIWKQTQESIRPISNEAKNSQRYKTRLQNEVKKYSERFETFDFRKEERNKANLSSEGRRIKEERDRIKTAYDAAVRKTVGISREEATILFDLAKQAAELKNLRDPNVKGNFGFKSAKERWEYGKAQAAFDKYVAKLKIGDESISTLAKNRLSEFKTEVKDNPAKAVGKLGIDAVGEVSATSISMVASLDVSFTLRQGGKMLMTHPTIWAKSVSKQVGDVYRALRYKHGNEVAKDILHADLVSRENYMDGHYQTAGILAKFEEQYPTSHPGRIPGIGRPFKASEIAFTNTALRMRIGYFDLLLDMAKKNGAEINTKLIKDLGAVVNGLTARSHIGGSKFVNVVLWAPRMIMANVNVLTAHGLGAGLSTKFARIESAKNLIKITAETAAVAAVLNAIVPGSIELDPRSSDFLKYKDGNTRIDMTAGSGQYITLVARFLTGQTKNTQTKIIKDLDKSGFGDRTYFDVGMDFLINKTTPLVRQGIYFAKGRNFEGRKPTAGTALVDLTTPIPIKNIADDSFGDYSDDRAIVLLSNLADVFGLNANTYMPLDQWENKESKELVAFRKRVGEQRFEEANIRYNKIVNSRISQTTKTPYYQALSDEEKEKVITRIKRQTKQQILSGY